MFCMGNPDKKQPEDIFKLYFDDELDEEEKSESLPTPEECEGMMAEMDAINAHFKEKAEE